MRCKILHIEVSSVPGIPAGEILTAFSPIAFFNGGGFKYEFGSAAPTLDWNTLKVNLYGRI